MNRTPIRANRYRDCEICDGQVDTFGTGYIKRRENSAVRHRLCHDLSSPPEGYVWVWDSESSTDAGVPHQYNCGHKILAPMSQRPHFCPECNNLEHVDGSWELAENDQDQESVSS